MRILLIGDSITEAFNTSKLLPEFKITNKGVYGDNTVGVLNRLREDVIEEKPDIVSILIGTNDFALEKSDDEILENIEEIIISLKAIDAEIVFCSILPVSNIINRSNERISSVNNGIEKLTVKHGINYWNIHKDFIETNGAIQKKYTYDGLHLNETGYYHWANLFREYFPSIISHKKELRQ